MVFAVSCLLQIRTVFGDIVGHNVIWRRQDRRGRASNPWLCKDAEKLRGQQRSVQTEKEAFPGHVQPALDTSSRKCAVPNLQPAVPGAPLRWKCRGCGFV